ncbi:MAG: MFS transporter [Saccharolobus sp.]
MIFQFILWPNSYFPLYGEDYQIEKEGRILGLTGEFISYLIYAFATSLWLLFLARIISGALTANYPLLQAYVADNVSEVERGKAYGILSAALGSGFVGVQH